MSPVSSSETSVDFQWTTRHYILEDRTLHNHMCENLKSYYKEINGGSLNVHNAGLHNQDAQIKKYEMDVICSTR
jgi:hypothetical protein